jgi:histone H3/H4
MEDLIAEKTMGHLLQSVGAERVSDDARAELKKFLEFVGEHISKKSIEFAHHAGRKTVKAIDIKLATKEVHFSIEKAE